MSEHDDLDPEALALVAAERRRPGAPSDVKERVRARLGIVPPGSGGGHEVQSRAGATPSITALAAKGAIATAFVGGLILGGALSFLRPPKERIIYIDRPAALSVEPRSQTVDPLPVASPPAPPSSLTDHAAPLPSASPSLAIVKTPAPSSLAEEQALLDGARVALGRHDAGDALRALHATDVHKRRFPSGNLAEEREAIAIQALVLLARHDEAVARGEAFKRTYPASALLPAVEEALGP